MRTTGFEQLNFSSIQGDIYSFNQIKPGKNNYYYQANLDKNIVELGHYQDGSIDV